MHPRLLAWFSDVDKEDKTLVGEKGLTLALLSQQGLPIASGFIVTTNAHEAFLNKTALAFKVKAHLEHLHTSDPLALMDASQAISHLIKTTALPEALGQEILQHYASLEAKSHLKKAGLFSRSTKQTFGVRIYGNGSYSPTISGEANVTEMIKEEWARLFEPARLYELLKHGHDPLSIFLPLIIQAVPAGEIVGKLYCIDPITGAKDRVVIESKDQRSGLTNRFIVSKASLAVDSVGHPLHLSTSEVEQLARFALQIERHVYFPFIAEYTLHLGQCVITRISPISHAISPTDTVPVPISEGAPPQEEQERVDNEGTIKNELLLRGHGVSQGLTTGPVVILLHASQQHLMRPRAILVLAEASQAFELAIKKASALIICDSNHDAFGVILCKKLGIPCVLGVSEAQEQLKNGMVLRVDGTLGEIALGELKPERAPLSQKSPTTVPSSAKQSDGATATKLYLDLETSSHYLDALTGRGDGVGVLRLDSLIQNQGVHPKKAISDRIQKVFSDNIAEQIRTIAQLYYPRPVICRLSDFQSHHYRSLKGGEGYEASEHNSLLGLRGASRHLLQPEALQLEVEAILKVRNKLGLKNVSVMVPFCRTPMELQEIKKLLSLWGLHRSPSLKLWFSCDVPANLLQISHYVEVGIDGIALNADSLGQLILGVDKQNANVSAHLTTAHAVLGESYAQVVKVCHEAKILSSLYGSVLLDLPDVVTHLVSVGITSVCVFPSHVEKVRELVVEAEKQKITGRSTLGS